MRVSYKQVAERFGFVNADLVACSFGFPEADPFFKIRFYPLWEHPLYLKAQDEGTLWAFADCEEGERDVTIYPRGLIAVHVSKRSEVEDCWFESSGPRLWDYEPDGQIFVNEPVDMATVVKVVSDELGATAEDLRRVISTYNDPTERTPFSLCLPRSVLLATTAALDAASVKYHPSNIPAAQPLPIAFVIDDEDWIIAADFDVDFPEFEHRPEWFTPSLA